MSEKPKRICSVRGRGEENGKHILPKHVLKANRTAKNECERTSLQSFAMIDLEMDALLRLPLNAPSSCDLRGLILEFPLHLEHCNCFETFVVFSFIIAIQLK